jgi:hypothetical protein
MERSFSVDNGMTSVPLLSSGVATMTWKQGRSNGAGNPGWFLAALRYDFLLTPVPEPGSVTLAGLGFAGLMPRSSREPARIW